MSNLHNAFVLAVTFLASCCLSSGVFADDSKKPQSPLFVCEARVVEAISGGPVALQVTMTYSGKQTVHLVARTVKSHMSSVTVPRSWEEMRRDRVVTGSIIGPGYKFIRCLPGTSFTEIHYLHHDFLALPHGVHEIAVSWVPYYFVDLPRSNGKTLQEVLDQAEGVELKKAIKLNVQPPTSARIDAFRQKISESLTSPALTESERKHALALLSYSNHERLIPLLEQLLRSPDNKRFKGRFVEQIYASTTTPERAHRVLRPFLCSTSPNLETALAIFDRWYTWKGTPWDRKKPDPRIPGLDEIRHLQTAPSIWVRCLAHVTFPTALSSSTEKELLDGLKRLAAAPSAEELETLLRCLRDQKFAVRERARQKFLEYGDTAVPFLKGLQKRSLSLDVKRQADMLVVEIENGRTDPAIQGVLSYIAWRASPQCRSILESLAHGSEDSRLGKEAKELLDKMRR